MNLLHCFRFTLFDVFVFITYQTLVSHDIRSYKLF